MEIKSFIEERIHKNHLSLNVYECVELIKKYEKIYPDVDEMKRFFYIILNKVGSILSNIDEDLCELLGWLRVRGRNDINFFEFEDEEDYLNWLNARVILYSKLTNKDDIRLLNFLELSTMNFITDITTQCLYEVTNDIETFQFNKTGYGTNKDKLSFIKYIVDKYNNQYMFKPIKI